MTQVVESGAQVQTHPLIDRLFRALDQRGVPWVLLRGAGRLSAESGDVDLLLSERWLGVAVEVARENGFVDAPAPGHGSHRFFRAYDRERDVWVHVDIVTRLAFGPHQELPVLSADELVAERIRAPRGWQLPPGDDLWALLLHYALDGAQLDDAKREELLAAQGGRSGVLTRRVREQLGDVAGLERAVHDGPEAVERVLDQILQQWPRKGARRRRLVDRSRRRLSRVLPGRRGPGLTVAVLGPDGAGKSTVIDGLKGQLPWTTRSYYIGVLRTTPLARQLRRIPGLMLVVRVCVFRGRYALAVHHRRRGRVVLFDRYTYDALMPVAHSSRRGGVSAAILLRLCPPPDRTIVLDAPASTMWERKGELGVEQLEDFRQRYLALHETVPHLTRVDAGQTADGVRREVTDLVYSSLLALQAGHG